jgi:bifunctional non-homologous end joining protein LigD
MPREKELVKVDGREIALSNLDKILYPAAKFTKGQVIDYYVRISKYLLPQLQDRPVTLLRYPNGVRGEYFYEKDAPLFTPDWIPRFSVPRRGRGGEIHYILINDVATLVWVANIASIELHSFLHRVPEISRPTYIVFDLDPGRGADVLACGKVALLVRDLLSQLNLQSFAKVSGSKGLQLYLPLNGAISYDVAQPVAKAIAELMEERYPKLVVSRMAKAARSQRVFIDWSQNSDFKTTVSVYSLRAKSDQPYVSSPVTWDELAAAVENNEAKTLYFDPEQALKRVERMGDIFAPALTLKQHLPEDVLNVLRPATAPPHALEMYSAKRNFAITPEPPPQPPQRSAQGSRRRFVVQKHAASHLHYDFRLEMHGVLKSWAVPKGPPLEPGMRRLAMVTEDHPLEYLDFEGIIPEGQYGGGTVMVWDIGTYDVAGGNYYRGYLRLFLSGKKLKGEWTLVRSPEAGNKWYMEKVGSESRPLSPKRANESALTRRTMQQIAEARDREWQSNREAANSPTRKPLAVASDKPLDELRLLPASKLKFIPPMLAKPVSRLPEGHNWQYEIKLDGYRALVSKKNDDITLFSRRGRSLNERFATIVGAFRTLPNGTILDGEIVALDEQGRPHFNALQHAKESAPLYFYAFDVLAYEGKELLQLPLSARRTVLERTVMGLASAVRISTVFDSPVQQLIAAVRQQGLEGVIAKRKDSLYEPGKRTGAWVKYRTAKGQELVIGGYIPGSHVFESLLVGYYENGRLIFLGKVRNGFTPALRKEIAGHFKGLETQTCPFDNLPEPKKARRGKALTREFMNECRWLKPELVAEVGFTDWTAANHLRHSKFIALRDDKNPLAVRKESLPAEAPKPKVANRQTRRRKKPTPGNGSTRPRRRRRQM